MLITTFTRVCHWPLNLSQNKPEYTQSLYKYISDSFQYYPPNCRNVLLRLPSGQFQHIFHLKSCMHLLSFRMCYRWAGIVKSV